MANENDKNTLRGDPNNPNDRPQTDPKGSVSPQKSTDPVYQGSQTAGGTDPSPRQPRNVTTDIRSSVGGTMGTDPNTARRGFVGFPKTLYHPVLGARSVNDPNEEASLPGPSHNWLPTPGEADMHRTDLEAQEVIHNSRRWKLEGVQRNIEGNEEPLLAEPPENPDEPIEPTNQPVRYSVQAEEVLKRGGVEPH